MTSRARAVGSHASRPSSWLAMLIAVALLLGPGSLGPLGARAQNEPVPAPTAPTDPVDASDASEPSETSSPADAPPSADVTGPSEETAPSEEAAPADESAPVDTGPVEAEPVEPENMPSETVEPVEAGPSGATDTTEASETTETTETTPPSGTEPVDAPTDESAPTPETESVDAPADAQEDAVIDAPDEAADETPAGAADEAATEGRGDAPSETIADDTDAADGPDSASDVPAEGPMPDATTPDATTPEATTPDVPETAPTVPEGVADGPEIAPITPESMPADPDRSSQVRPLDISVGVERVGDELVATQAGTERWRLTFDPEAGRVTEPSIDGDVVRVGHGLYLLAVDLETGIVASRSVLPAVARELFRNDEGVLEVVVDHGGEIGTRNVRAPAGQVDPPVRFGIDVDALHGLARAARSVADPTGASERDPTDPWLALQAARMAPDPVAATAALDRVVTAGEALPFFETLPLADRLLTIGETSDSTDRYERASTLYEDALADLADRGYDPRLVTDATLRDAYGFPDARLRDALSRGDLDEALVVAPYVWRLAAEEAPGSVVVLRDLADALREDGRRDEAGIWRGRARALDRAGLDTWVDALALRLGALGWWGVAGLLASFVLLWIVLGAKVWKAQSLARRQLKERDQAPPPVTRLWVVRHASTTEKLALAVLLIVAGLQAALAGWHADIEDPAPVLRSGTLASAEAIAAVDALPDTARAAWIRGLSFAQQGRLDDAVATWREAGSLAPALTGRALAQGGDEGLLEAALTADPREPVARFYSGRAADPSPFHATTAPDAPLWAVPSPLDLRLATAGDWSATLAQAVTSPWLALGEARPDAFPAWIAWILAVLYGLLFLSIVAFLFLPRPRVSRDAPRTLGYHVGALLVPGSGHADELWGLLLLVPWSLIGADALLTWASGMSPLGLSSATQAWLLAVLWAINTIGFAVEYGSYRHRMRLVRERKPELARSYGLPPAPRPEA